MKNTLNIMGDSIENIWGLLLNCDWMVHLVECPNVLTPICNLLKG